MIIVHVFDKTMRVNFVSKYKHHKLKCGVCQITVTILLLGVPLYKFEAAILLVVGIDDNFLYLVFEMVVIINI